MAQQATARASTQPITTRQIGQCRLGIRRTRPRTLPAIFALRPALAGSRSFEAPAAGEHGRGRLRSPAQLRPFAASFNPNADAVAAIRKGGPFTSSASSSASGGRAAAEKRDGSDAGRRRDPQAEGATWNAVKKRLPPPPPKRGSLRPSRWGEESELARPRGRAPRTQPIGGRECR